MQGLGFREIDFTGSKLTFGSTGSKLTFSKLTFRALAATAGSWRCQLASRKVSFSTEMDFTSRKAS